MSALTGNTIIKRVLLCALLLAPSPAPAHEFQNIININVNCGPLPGNSLSMTLPSYMGLIQADIWGKAYTLMRNMNNPVKIYRPRPIMKYTPRGLVTILPDAQDWHIRQPEPVTSAWHFQIAELYKNGRIAGYVTFEDKRKFYFYGRVNGIYTCL